MSVNHRNSPGALAASLALSLFGCAGSAEHDGPAEEADQSRGSLLVTIQPYDGAMLRTARYVVARDGEAMASGTATIRDPEHALELSLSLPRGEYEVAFDASTPDSATCRASVGPVTISADAVATVDESWQCLDANGDPL